MVGLGGADLGGDLDGEVADLDGELDGVMADLGGEDGGLVGNRDGEVVDLGVDLDGEVAGLGAELDGEEADIDGGLEGEVDDLDGEVEGRERRGTRPGGRSGRRARVCEEKGGNWGRERRENVDTGEGEKLAKGLLGATSLKFCERAAAR